MSSLKQIIEQSWSCVKMSSRMELLAAQRNYYMHVNNYTMLKMLPLLLLLLLLLLLAPAKAKTAPPRRKTKVKLDEPTAKTATKDARFFSLSLFSIKRTLVEDSNTMFQQSFCVCVYDCVRPYYVITLIY